MDIGRNDACPCGSGKKYKKCCLSKDTRFFSPPDELQTGTLLDEYHFLFKGIALYGEGLKQFGDDKKVLRGVYDQFEKRFRPGTAGGVSDGLFMTWFYLDNRFGEDQETIGERFIEEGLADKLVDPGPRLIGDLVDSYCAFYQIKSIEEESFFLEELWTGREWRVFRVDDIFEDEAKEGCIWYVRLVGHPGEAYPHIAPYVFEPDSKKGLLKVIAQQIEGYMRYVEGYEVSKERIFIDSCKASLIHWAETFIDEPAGFKAEKAAQLPVMLNTDHEPLRFSKLLFKIIQHEGLKEKLSNIAGFKYDSAARTWIWSKKGNKKIKAFPTTMLGSLKIQGDRVVAETNSLSRALKLKNKLQKQFAKHLSYEKIETNDLALMPPPTKKEAETFRKQQEELHANPEVRKFMKQQAENYYYENWIKQRIPALGNKTPLQASKTEQGRKKLEKLLQLFEEGQQKNPDDPFKADMNVLRKKLALL